MINKGEIEISFEVEMAVGAYFNIDKKKWEALSDDEKRQMIAGKAEELAGALADDVLRFPNTDVVLSASVFEPSLAHKVDLDKLQFYNPEKEA